MNKIDVIIPICRKEIDSHNLQERFKLLEDIGDIDGVTYTILLTLSDPEIQLHEMQKIVNKNFFKIVTISNDEYRRIANECNYKNFDHYYSITSVTWEYIVRNKSALQTGECFYLFHISDKIPFSLKWASGIYKAWCDVGKPYTSGEWWHGCKEAGHGPTMGDIFSWKWADIKRKWGGWGAYDRELSYMAFDNQLTQYPNSCETTLRFLKFLREHLCPDDMVEDLSWVDKMANGITFHIIHEKSPTVYDAIRKKIYEIIYEASLSRQCSLYFSSLPFSSLSTVVYMNLDSRVDRRNHIEEQLIRNSISFSRVPAHSPKLCYGFSTPGTYGCLLTHRNIIAELARQNIESALIFEDDCVIPDGSAGLIREAIEELPTDWGVLYFMRDGRDYNQPVDTSSKLERINATLCSHAYAIHRRAYQPILDEIQRSLDSQHIPLDNCLMNVTSSPDSGVRAYCTKHISLQQACHVNISGISKSDIT
jgi:GR25 family glycosyltransferase involved in LPS biosynthesis